MPDRTGERPPPAAPARRRAHLMVPGQPHRPVPTPASTRRVQRWVVSILLFSTVFHLAVGLVVAAVSIDPSVPTSRIGLLVIAGVMGLLAAVAACAIHQRRPQVPWLLLGLAPALVGVYLCFLR